MKYQKMNQKQKHALRAAVLLIRFRSLTPNTSTRKYATYNTISKSLNLTQYEVQHICRKALKAVKAPTAKQKERKLEQKHFDFLLSSRTLEQWAGQTMKQRQVRFHR